MLLAIRSLPAKGDMKGAMDALRAVKIYPLATAANPKLLTFVDMTGRIIDSTPLRWEDNLQFWQVLHGVLSAESVVDEFRPMYGVLAALGIEKGKPFAPDPRMRAILEQAAKTGRDQMLVSAFDSTRPDRIAWTDRKWEWLGLQPNSADFETPAGLDLEARDRWFAQAIVASPAMFRRMSGSGSLYWLGHRDEAGAYLDGGKTYKLSVPIPAPAQLFWSVTVYDPETRSEIQTDQGRAALRSLFELQPELERLAIGREAIDLYFGPSPPPARSTCGSRPFRAGAGLRTSESTAPSRQPSTAAGGREILWR